MRGRNDDMQYEMIAAYLDGNLSDSEKVRVENWRNASEENASLFKDMQQLWDASGALSNGHAYDSEAGWKKMSALMEEEETDEQETKNTGKTVRMKSWWLSTAAVFVFAMVAYWWTNKGMSYEELHAGSQMVTDTLSDGSIIHLNENTTLRIAQKYGEKVRAVWLQGEALFEVKPDTMPFYVYTQYARIEVVGTVFDVVSREKEPVELSVQRGKVKITSGWDASVEKVVKAGEKVIYYDKQKTIEPVAENAANDIYWYNKTLVFDRTPLPEVFSKMEEVYGVEIDLSNADIKSCKLTGTYQMMTVDNVLDIITSTFELSYQHHNDQVIIKGAGCP